MSGDPRDLDTYNDFDEPDHMPVVGDRVLVALDEPERQALGTITYVNDNGYGCFSYNVKLDGYAETAGVEVDDDSILEFPDD